LSAEEDFFMRLVAAILLLAFAGGPPCLAQRSAQAESTGFEVASVRVNPSSGGRGGFSVERSGRVAITNLSLRSIIANAYGIDFTSVPYALIGGPPEILDKVFDISALPPAEGPKVQSPQEQSLLMLRQLLSDRFGLRIHKETRQLPVYVLTRKEGAPLGPNLRRSDYDCPSARAALGREPGVSPDPTALPSVCAGPSYTIKNGVTTFSEAGPLKLLVTKMEGFLDRKLLDQTGLTGNFQWQLTFSLKATDSEFPSIFGAVERDLGLKLESRNGSSEVFIIDSVKMPTPN
jgi:uncharacterized protein (TIGR03435 family)